MDNANGVNGAPSTYFDPITGTTKPLITFTRDTFPAGTVTIDPRVNALFNGVGDFLTKQQSVGYYDYYAEASQKHRGHQTLVTNTTTLDFGPAATVKNIFGYNNVISREQSTITGSPYEFLTVGGGATEEDKGYTFGTKEYSDELQLSGKAGNLKYIVGAYYSHIKSRSRIPLVVAGILGAPYLGPYDFTLTDKSKALYAQVTYALTPRLNLSGGIRYTWEDVSILQAPDSLVAILNGGNHSRKDSKPSWLAGIDYKITDNLLVYFNHRGSWRTGGFNGTSAASFPNASTFEPETTYDFELGAKFAGDIGTVRSRFNIALYDQYIRHVQRAPYLNISALAGNVNKARVSGVEADADFTLTRGFEIGGAFTYTNARYTDARATVAGANFLFGPYGDAPKYSGSAFFRASTELADGGELALRGEVFAQSSFFYSNLANTILPNTKIRGYALVNARAEWNKALGTKIDLAAFVNNLTQRHYAVGGFPLGAVTGSNGTLPGTPRMFGIEASVRF
jgi:iron complex outermembrane receptor protein